MTREQVFLIMGPAEETFAYIEGQSLPHMKRRTAYEWGNSASMAAPNRVSIDDDSGEVHSIRCGDASVNTSIDKR